MKPLVILCAIKHEDKLNIFIHLSVGDEATVDKQQVLDEVADTIDLEHSTIELFQVHTVPLNFLLRGLEAYGITLAVDGEEPRLDT